MNLKNGSLLFGASHCKKKQKKMTRFFQKGGSYEIFWQEEIMNFNNGGAILN